MSLVFFNNNFAFITGTAEDYKLLEQMNKVTIGKYQEMKTVTVNIDKAMKDLNEKCKYTTSF